MVRHFSKIEEFIYIFHLLTGSNLVYVTGDVSAG